MYSSGVLFIVYSKKHNNRILTYLIWMHRLQTMFFDSMFHMFCDFMFFFKKLAGRAYRVYIY